MADAKFKPNDPRLMGNKFGKNGGRPRTVSFSPEEMIELGEEMLDWVKENDPIHLSKWYSIEKCFTDAQWRVMTDAPEFSPYYNQALKIVGYKYLIKDSPIEPSLKQRWQRVYFKDLRDEENDTKKLEANIRKEEEGRNKQNITVNVNGKGLGSGIEVSTETVSTSDY